MTSRRGRSRFTIRRPRGRIPPTRPSSFAIRFPAISFRRTASIRRPRKYSSTSLCRTCREIIRISPPRFPRGTNERTTFAVKGDHQFNPRHRMSLSLVGTDDPGFTPHGLPHPAGGQQIRDFGYWFPRGTHDWVHGRQPRESVSCRLQPADAAAGSAEQVRRAGMADATGASWNGDGDRTFPAYRLELHRHLDCAGIQRSICDHLHRQRRVVVDERSPQLQVWRRNTEAGDLQVSPESGEHEFFSQPDGVADRHRHDRARLREFPARVCGFSRPQYLWSVRAKTKHLAVWLLRAGRFQDHAASDDQLRSPPRHPDAADRGQRLLFDGRYDQAEPCRRQSSRRVRLRGTKRCRQSYCAGRQEFEQPRPAAGSGVCAQRQNRSSRRVRHQLFPDWCLRRWQQRQSERRLLADLHDVFSGRPERGLHVHAGFPRARPGDSAADYSGARCWNRVRQLLASDRCSGGTFEELECGGPESAWQEHEHRRRVCGIERGSSAGESGYQSARSEVLESWIAVDQEHPRSAGCGCRLTRRPIAGFNGSLAQALRPFPQFPNMFPGGRNSDTQRHVDLRCAAGEVR